MEVLALQQANQLKLTKDLYLKNHKQVLIIKI
jgi:hypothetical protein